MSELNITYAGLNLKNPIIVGSSGLTGSVVNNIAWEKAGCGAIVLKSLFEEQIENESNRLLEEGHYPDAYHYIKNYVRGNKVIEYLNLISETKKHCSVPIIASMNCYDAGAWLEFAARIEYAGADAIELNIAAITANPMSDPMESAHRYINIVKKIKESIAIPVIVKSSKLFNNIPWLVNQLKLNGVDAVVLFNKLFQPDINIDSLKVTSGSVFSSPSDLSETLRWIALTSLNVPGIDLAASTGVYDWKDVIKCLLVGASVVQLVSTLYKNKNERVIQEMISFIYKWMDDKGYKDISSFRGKINEDPSVDASVFERAQFMRYFSNYHHSR